NAQANKMMAKATKTVAAQQMAKRAERLLAGLEDERATEKVANLRFPAPADCGRVPLTAEGLSRSFGSTEVFTGVDLAIDKGTRVVVLGYQGAGKTTLLRLLAGLDEPDSGEVVPGHGLKLAFYAQDHEPVGLERTVMEKLARRHTHRDDSQERNVLDSFLFSGDDVHKPACVRSGGRRRGWPWPPSWSRVRMCSCSTSRRTTSIRPPVRRSSQRSAAMRERSCS